MALHKGFPESSHGNNPDVALVSLTNAALKPAMGHQAWLRSTETLCRAWMESQGGGRAPTGTPSAY